MSRHRREQLSSREKGSFLIIVVDEELYILLSYYLQKLGKLAGISKIRIDTGCLAGEEKSEKLRSRIRASVHPGQYFPGDP